MYSISIFLFYILLIWGCVRTQRTPCLRAWCRCGYRVVYTLLLSGKTPPLFAPLHQAITSTLHTAPGGAVLSLRRVASRAIVRQRIIARMMFLATERPRNPLLKTSLSGNEFRPDAAVVDQQYSQPAAAAAAAAARVKEWAMTEWDLGPDAPCCVTAPTPGTFQYLLLAYTAVFTCIGPAVSTPSPSQTGPLARKYLPGFPYS